LSSTLFIMDKAGPNSLNEKSINPELMVRCIRYNPKLLNFSLSVWYYFKFLLLQ
jgi:hypothetical protein